MDSVVKTCFSRVGLRVRMFQGTFLIYISEFLLSYHFHHTSEKKMENLNYRIYLFLSVFICKMSKHTSGRVDHLRVNSRGTLRGKARGCNIYFGNSHK